MVQETAQLATDAANSGLLGTLGIDLGKFLGQLVNFSIVVFVMWRWVYKPLLKMMDARTKEIETGLANAKEAQESLAMAKSEQERMMQEARTEAHGVIAAATNQAELVRKDKMAQVKTEIEKIAIEAKAQIRSEREAAFDALKRDIADMIGMATQKVAAGIDEKGQRQLIDKAVKDLENA